ncbi:MAG: zinc-dependent alcohol dehydrogenase [bacterium]
MRAAKIKQNSIVVEQIPKPEPRSGEVSVEVRYCGICGSDVHRFAAGGLPDGAILGHEAYGVVKEVGGGVADWHGGERVVITGYDPCGRCRWCQKAEYQLCLDKYWIGLGANPGAFAEYVKVRASMLLRVPESVSDRTAALTEPLAVALHAVRTAHINIGDTAVIVGAGPVGLLVMQCLQVAGARAVGVIEIAPSRARLASRLGADGVFTPGSEDLRAEVASALGSEPDIAFDCAGAVQTLQGAADLVGPDGKIMLVGLSLEPVPITPLEWQRKEAELKACIAYRDEFPLALELLARGKIDVDPLISDVVSLEDIDAVIKDLRRPNEQVKVLVTP